MVASRTAIDGALVPYTAVAVDTSSTDFDCTVLGLGFARRLYVGGAGDVKVTFLGGGVVTYKSKPQGSFVDGAITKVWKTGTSATDLIAEE